MKRQNLEQLPISLENEQYVIQNAHLYFKDDIREAFPDDPWLYNQMLNSWEYGMGLTQLESYPVDVSFPITDRCNAACRFCGYCDNSRNVTYELEAIDKYAELAPYLIRAGVCPIGEPLLHPRIIEIISKLRMMTDSRCSLYIVTNGILLNRFLYTLAELTNSVTVSLNAATAERHSDIMGISPDCFHKITKSIVRLVELRDRYKKDLWVQASFVVTSRNIADLPRFIKMANEFGLNKVWLNTLLSPTQTSTPGNNEKSDYEKLYPYHHPSFEQLYGEIEREIEKSEVSISCEMERWKRPQENKKFSPAQRQAALHGVRHMCRFVYSNLMDQLPYHKQPVCCLINKVPEFDFIKFDQSTDFLQKVWNSPQFVFIRESLKNGDLLPACRACNFLETFKNQRL